MTPRVLSFARANRFGCLRGNHSEEDEEATVRLIKHAKQLEEPINIGDRSTRCFRTGVREGAIWGLDRCLLSPQELGAKRMDDRVPGIHDRADRDPGFRRRSSRLSAAIVTDPLEWKSSRNTCVACKECCKPRVKDCLAQNTPHESFKRAVEGLGRFVHSN